MIANNHPDLSFNKSLKLLNSHVYKAVFDDAQIKVSNQRGLFLARPNRLNQPRLGLVIAKKNVRLATQRNRIKRIARESFRVRQHQLKGVDVVFLARRDLDKLSNIELQQLFDQLWLQLKKKADKKIGQQSKAHT